MTEFEGTGRRVLVQKPCYHRKSRYMIEHISTSSQALKPTSWNEGDK